MNLKRILEITTVTIAQSELCDLIADYVANKSGSSIDPKDKIKVNLRQVDRGPLGFQYEADVTITREMGNCEG